ncbi:glycosyltransferase family 4 protein [Patescibacteria group bacterium]|nr:glycosyltransferase family 4 protein [Patescibacteria group bacterium]MBU0879710.1 glycosyltransferase family 4 protein [Patescibacteria group bacterium]MBU0879941.1 glycosyltransferase family 4 protein [Patescibacteria group bacterium]MBU0897854.1 glycosyltransferase family 4 protein [Patescibacteria group bacterium]MBU1062571.1 glycosyltransferase family 4 protein [Patescibacteria group bacterium]
MLIGIDARFYGPIGKGLGRYVQEVIDNLIEIDQVNKYVIFLGKENFADFKIVDSKRVKKIMINIGWYGFKEQLLFPFYIWREHLDLMHFPHFNVPIACPVKFVVTIHDLILIKYPTLRATTLNWLFYKIKNLAYKLIISSAIKHSQKIIAVSDFTKKDIISQFKVLSEKVVVTYEGVAETLIQKQQNQNDLEKKDFLLSNKIVKPYLLYVGNGYPHKNLEGLIKAFQIIIKKYDNLQLVLVGRKDYFYKRLKEYAEELNLWQENSIDSKIIFPDFVPDNKLNILYNQALFYIFPSFYEGFGLPPLEAMANGCPVISSNRTSLPEILGQASNYFNPEDQSDMLCQIERLINDSDLRKRLVKLGYEQIKKYSWKDCAKKTLEVYENCLKIEN